MILILTCDNCRRTSAVRAVIDSMDSPRKETWLLWNCMRCSKHHQWLIPHGRSLEDTARQSFKSSLAYGKSGEREDVYFRLSNASPEIKRKILFGELIWWWREEVPGGLTLAMVAEAAGITVRQWIRIEAGASLPHKKNLVGIVHAVDGIMDQAYLLTDSDKIWNHEMERRLADEEERISPDALFQKAPKDYTLQAWESPDVEIALQALREVLPYEPDADHFLFYAHTVHQEYWGRLLGGPITVDDNRTEVIPAVKKIIDLLERCNSKRAQYMVIHVMAREVAFFTTKTQVADLVNYFVLRSFASIKGEDETRRRIGEEWNKLSTIERLILTLFDLVEPQYQARLVEACKKLQDTARVI
jgi:hypothetical protein